jgi:hypothetical protein
MSFEDDWNAQILNSLEEAGRQIVAEVRASMPFAEGPSRVGEPPHSHTGRLAASTNAYAAMDGDRPTLVLEAFAPYAGYVARLRPFLEPVLERWQPVLTGRVLTSLATG